MTQNKNLSLKKEIEKMKEEINKLIRRLLFWVLKDKIRAYAISHVIPEIDLIQFKGEITEYVKLEMALKIGTELLKDGAIEIEEEFFNPAKKDVRYIMRLYCVNFGKKILTPKD